MISEFSKTLYIWFASSKIVFKEWPIVVNLIMKMFLFLSVTSMETLYFVMWVHGISGKERVKVTHHEYLRLLKFSHYDTTTI